MTIRKLKFQVGDWVRTPRSSGRITAIGMSDYGHVLYRLGRNQYWFDWQLRRVRHDN